MSGILLFLGATILFVVVFILGALLIPTLSLARVTGTDGSKAVVIIHHHPSHGDICKIPPGILLSAGDFVVLETSWLRKTAKIAGKTTEAQFRKMNEPLYRKFLLRLSR